MVDSPLLHVYLLFIIPLINSSVEILDLPSINQIVCILLKPNSCPWQYFHITLFAQCMDQWNTMKGKDEDVFMKAEIQDTFISVQLLHPIKQIHSSRQSRLGISAAQTEDSRRIHNNSVIHHSRMHLYYYYP